LNFGSSSAPSTISPPNRIGPIEHDERNTLLPGRLHRERHRRHVGPGAAAHFLQVVDQDIDIAQHFRRGSVVLRLVEREDRDAGLWILLVSHCRTRRRIAADAVLGREEGDQLQVLMLRDQIDVRCARAIHGAVIGDQRDALAAKRRRDIGEKDLDPGPHGTSVLRGDGQRQRSDDQCNENSHQSL
jgi:hypothetical protein